MLKHLRNLLPLSILLFSPSAQAGMGDIHPVDLPMELLDPADTVTLTWTEPLPCVLQVGPDPTQLDTTVPPLSSLPGELSFQPEAAGLAPGVWVAMLVDLTGTNSSLPFYLFIEAESAPVMTSPQNGGEVEPGSARLSWEPVLGIPYYHVLLSDQEIVIDEDENGDPVISGANIIWQAIVSTTSAEYGSWDPSGFFNDMNGTPPPLVPGPLYNWVVLNNYGNNPALTSSRQAGVSSFGVIDDSGLEPPTLLSPAEDAVLSDDLVTFTWTAVEGASHYHLYLSRIVDSEESEGAVGVFDQITGQTLLDLPAASLLVDSRYLWKVFALDGSGQGVASVIQEFVYETAMGELKIRTRDGEGDPLAHVQVELIPVGGGGSTLPVLTGTGGTWSDDLVPGDYLLAAAKDGHEPAEGSATVVHGQLTEVLLQLPASPATITGSVRTEGAAPVPFADVTAVDSQTGETRAVQASASGGFQIGVSAGTWSLTAAKTGYHAPGTVDVTVSPGEYFTLGEDLVLAANASALGGMVLSEGGLPIVAALVTVTRDDGSDEQILTGGDGIFQFSLDAGSWTVSVGKPGYVAPAPRTRQLDPGDDLTIDPPLVLGARAVILSGFVTAEGGVVGEAAITATPETGGAVQTTSGPQGSWQLSLAPGTWTLSAAKQGYSPGAPLQLVLAPGGSQSGLSLPLQANPCTVSGTVSDGAQGLSGATVSNGNVETVSAWDGSYTLTLPAGTQALDAWLTGYSSGGSVPVDLSPGQTLSGLDFLLGPNAATVSGVVLSGGSPVAGARVVLDDGGQPVNRTSDAGGAYTISAPPGSYQLHAEKEGMESSMPLALALGPGQSLPGRDLELTPATALIGGLVRTDGAGLRDAQVTASSGLGDYSTGSSLSGGWALQLPAGTIWTVTVTKSGYDGDTATTPLLASGADWNHDFDLTLQPAVLRGQVIDDEDFPVVGAEVVVQGPGPSVSGLTDASGNFELGLEPGSVLLSVDEPGYSDYQTSLTLTTGVNEHDIVLPARFASLGGRVRAVGGAPIPGAVLVAQGAGSAMSDAEGDYLFPRLLAGTVDVSVEATGHEAASVELILTQDENASFDFVLVELTGTLGGTVIDGQGAPLAGASVQLREGATLVSQQLSDAAGSFAFQSLPTDRVLKLSASLADHSASSTNPLTGLLAPQAGLQFILAADDGVIRGTVVDADSGDPVPGAELTADDGAGYYGQAISGEDGTFLMAGLRIASPYTLSADASGWSGTSLAGILADGADREIVLQAAPARIYGTLSSGRSDASWTLPEDSRVRVIPSLDSSNEVNVAVDGLGDYVLDDLPPGEYTLLFRVDGHLTEPRQQVVTVAEGQNAGPYDFELVEAPIAELAISGVEEIDNDGSALFRGTQSTDSGEQVDYPLAWSLSPADAGELDAATGRFTPRGDYFGQITLTALHESSGLVASRDVSVYAWLEADSSRELDDGQGLLFTVPAGAVDQNVRITVQRHEPSPVKRRAGSYRVDGDLYHFLPDGLVFADGSQPELTLPLPGAAFNRSPALGWWDPERLRWDALEGQKTGEGLLRELEHFSDYALLVLNAKLGVASAAVSPNPFSPSEGGAEIRFTLSSQSMAAPLVDVTLFNMLGDPVRRLLEREALSVGIEHVLPWDGRTDAGSMARNGRYLVRIRVHDNSGEKEKILQAVLIK